METIKNRFSVILTHYNQNQYIYTAIDSILNQSYQNIELIISDDASKQFDSSILLKYINKHKKNNIHSVHFVVNENNIGSVKTINKCLKKATGEYIYMFAADDMIYDELVLEQFAEIFQKEKNISVVSSACLLCDQFLAGEEKRVPDKRQIELFNKKSAKEQNKALLFGPVFAPGATSYRKSLFEKQNFLDEQYVLIEDWSWFLRITRENVKVYIKDFISFKHRGGGVSETNQLPKKIQETILKDTDKIYKQEVFPYMSDLTCIEKMKILKRYQSFGRLYETPYYSIIVNYYIQIMKDFNLFILFLKEKKILCLKIFCVICSIIITTILHFLFPRISALIISMLPAIIYLFFYYIAKLIRKVTL